MQAISTHLGTYRVERLFFGIKTAPNDIHRIIDQIIQGLDGTIAYFDILIQGSTYEECRKRLYICLDKLQKYELHLNKQKCKFFQRSIKYLVVIAARSLVETPSWTDATSVRCRWDS